MIVVAPAKSICSQSGKLPGVPSCQPPPAPQLTPRRSPLIAPAAPNPLSAEEAVAMAPALAAATLTPPLTGSVTEAASLTATVHPAMVTVPLRAAPSLAAALTVTTPLPDPPDALRLTQLAAGSLAACQLQPDGAVTDTDWDPPAAGKAIDVVDTAKVQVGAASPAMASTSAMRLRVSAAPVTSTRMWEVVRAGNVTVRQTFWLPVMAPPGTASHCVPSQYWTVKLVTPYFENSCVVVGSTGAA